MKRILREQKLEKSLEKNLNKLESNRLLILDKMCDIDKIYLKKENAKCKEPFRKVQCGENIKTDFLVLYRVDEITFEDKSPRKEALENVITSMDIQGVNFVYLIIGNEKGVSFYYGVAKDFSEDANTLEINDIGDMILKPSLQGNFRGSVISEVNADEKKSILKKLESMRRTKVLEGVPGINKDDENFQSVDRIIDVMLGDNFALMLIAKPVGNDKICRIQDNIYNLYNVLVPLAKVSYQSNEGQNSSTGESKTTGSSKTTGNSISKTEQQGKSATTTHGTGKNSGTNKSTSTSTSTEKKNMSGAEGSTEGVSSTDSVSNAENESKSKTEGSSKSETKSESKGESTQKGTSSGSATTIDNIHKKLQEWMKYMDDIIFPRLDYAFGKGMFLSSMILLGNEQASLIKLENTIRSVYGGESGNRMPLCAFEVDDNEISYLKKMQIPVLTYANPLLEQEINFRTICSQMFQNDSKVWLGNWMSSREISLLAGIPQKEVVGMSLREEVEFGLNMNEKMDSPILLGHLVQSGVVLNGENGTPDIKVHFDKSYFDKHIFVTGVTGSGKTTTCQKLLLESKENFLVIEPAKTEYRVLATNEFKDMLVFTLGKETGAPFRLNPFEFFKGENITSRVDMIKASMEAAFDMEAAIPQLLETAIYACYEDKGWDISTNKNHNYVDPYADGVQAFPTLGELEKKIEIVVKQQGFDDRLRDEYIGSIRARLKGLTVGAKGLMLNTPRSIDFVELLDRKVVLELENIKSASEKSLIMGFILTNLSEAIRMKYNQNHEAIEHLTLIEEAHRLLSKYMPGDSMNKKQGVEMFSDMLAEVRKYGESLIIADQIPNKLTPEVLKNTNTKIVHKIFAQDDKEAIGNTMALKDEQKEHLSYLTSGRAVMMHPGLSKAIQVQIARSDANDTERIPPEDNTLRNKIIDYYCNVYQRGILPGLEHLPEKPEREVVEVYLDEMQPDSSFIRDYKKCIHKKQIPEGFCQAVNKLGNRVSYSRIARIICYSCHKLEDVKEYPQIETYIQEFLRQIGECEEGYNIKQFDAEKYDYIDSSLVR